MDIDTKENRELLAEARKHRPECVLEVKCPRLYTTTRIMFWRSVGFGFCLADEGFATQNHEVFRNGAEGWETGGQQSHLLEALRSKRILGLDAVEAEWCRKLARDNGIEIAVPPAPAFSRRGVACAGANQRIIDAGTATGTAATA